jgi:hypothetical protein
MNLYHPLLLCASAVKFQFLQHVYFFLDTKVATTIYSV